MSSSTMLTPGEDIRIFECLEASPSRFPYDLAIFIFSFHLSSGCWIDRAAVLPLVGDGLDCLSSDRPALPDSLPVEVDLVLLASIMNEKLRILQILTKSQWDLQGRCVSSGLRALISDARMRHQRFHPIRYLKIHFLLPYLDVLHDLSSLYRSILIGVLPCF